MDACEHCRPSARFKRRHVVGMQCYNAPHPCHAGPKCGEVPGHLGQGRMATPTMQRARPQVPSCPTIASSSNLGRSLAPPSALATLVESNLRHILRNEGIRVNFNKECAAMHIWKLAAESQTVWPSARMRVVVLRSSSLRSWSSRLHSSSKFAACLEMAAEAKQHQLCVCEKLVRETGAREAHKPPQASRQPPRDCRARLWPTKHTPDKRVAARQACDHDSNASSRCCVGGATPEAMSACARYGEREAPRPPPQPNADATQGKASGATPHRWSQRKSEQPTIMGNRSWNDALSTPTAQCRDP